jgi:uncharacterized lipoprotein YajG
MKPTRKIVAKPIEPLHHIPSIRLVGSKKCNQPMAFLLALIALVFLSGCATTLRSQKVGPTQILEAQEEIPENQLMDVGILVFESEEMTQETAEKEKTTAEIRKAESNYMPYHLKNTLQQSSQWGAVRVVPDKAASTEIVIKTKIVKSNGEKLVLDVDVADAAGIKWFHKSYVMKADRGTYSNTIKGEKDAFQNLYNTIANDMAEHKLKLSPEEIQTVRTVSQLKFAEDFAPVVYEGYLTKDKKDKLTINRLPADDDPMMKRLQRIREREYMYVDVLNNYYEVFYNEIWTSYENWRQLSYDEIGAIRKIKRDAMIRQLAGALMIAGAVALGASDISNTAAVQTGMIILGGQVLINGINISKEAKIHSEAIKELSESFGNEMKPIVMDFEGKQYELTGSAQEQFDTWRKLLRQIYYAETGFGPDSSGDPANPSLSTEP